ncbi:hypothetical protein SAMN04489731_102583 [Amycolatopsis regifaucium]|nr:hypothetical protein SAMN04489731_102583 [Amycolatopsis regifaucium]
MVGAKPSPGMPRQGKHQVLSLSVYRLCPAVVVWVRRLDGAIRDGMIS